MSLADDIEEAVMVVALTAIQEASLGRIYQHHRERYFIILTAWRGERTQEENETALKALKQRIRAAGFGFIPLEGVGQETRESEIIQAVEPSLLVPNSKKGLDDGSFRKMALSWALKASKPPQDYIFYATPTAEGGTDAAVLKVSSGAADFKLSKFSPSSVGEFYSRLRRGRTFKYEWIGIKYGDPPSGWIHGMGMESEGRERIAEFSETLEDWQERFADFL